MSALQKAIADSKPDVPGVSCLMSLASPFDDFVPEFELRNDVEGLLAKRPECTAVGDIHYFDARADIVRPWPRLGERTKGAWLWVTGPITPEGNQSFRSVP
jgi:hypothetical protein